ncbi:hypothetical protein BJY04DRAFT_220435 [Aspergillus karnatakaensis]|uniref:uncharacterized protein n=1 Tax=Aspergillus karnatakaensis TaxID=1810916 RepID=UPI003CCD90BB
MSPERQPINTAQAPPPRAFYNQAVVANGFVFCSGQLPKDSTGKLVEGTVQDRAREFHAAKAGHSTNVSGTSKPSLSR